MASDIQFFNNSWEGMRSYDELLPEQISPGETFDFDISYILPEDGKYILDFDFSFALILRIDGVLYKGSSMPVFVCGRCCYEMVLKKGEKRLRFSLLNPGEKMEKPFFKARLLDEEYRVVNQNLIVPLPQEPVSKEDLSEPDLEGFRPGAGAAFKTCGRFGFTKGDGVLDYSMPAFGIVSRPFISGNPQCSSNCMWHFSLLPEGEKETASLDSSYDIPPEEKIENDWSHVHWRRNLRNGRFISYDYSLLSPALLIETDLDYIRLDRLGGIGGFASMTMPLAAGAVTRMISGNVVYDAAVDGPLVQNWLMLSRSGQFPEVPLLLMFRESPVRIEAFYAGNGRLRTLVVRFDASVEWCFLEMPFGIRLFHSSDLSPAWYESAVRLCRRRQREALARPCSCREYFCFEAGSMHIVQKFEFSMFADSLHTPPCRIAPIPPPVLIAASEVKEIRADARAEDLEFPTKYGPLFGVRDRSWAEYFVPVASARSGIAPGAVNAEQYAGMLHRDFDDFLRFHQDAKKAGHPGCYAFVFQYAFVGRLFPFLRKEDREKLEELLREGLHQACDPDFEYDGPGGRRCLAWYLRTEPFSKVSYYITYLHVNRIYRFGDCTRRTVENDPGIMVETDWGNAMALYGIWLAALLTGEWNFIASHWAVLRKVFDYYLGMMDWACMAAGYCENGVSWNDGMNFGAYTAFMNMAEMTGSREDFELARYAYAKMTALRLGLFFYAQKYLCRYLEVNPWWTAKCFHEETDCRHAFACYPAASLFGDYRMESLYNMSTEGHYLEAWSLYQTYAEKELQILLDRLEHSVPYSLTGPRPPDVESCYQTMDDHVGWQEVCTYLALCILTRRYPRRELERMIEEAFAEERISREFIGAVPWSQRRVPAECIHVYLLALLEGIEDIRLTAWKGLRIVTGGKRQLEVLKLEEKAWLEFTALRCPRVELNHLRAAVEFAGTGLFRMEIRESGVISFL